jgi:hypothetical protein
MIGTLGRGDIYIFICQALTGSVSEMPRACLECAVGAVETVMRLFGGLPGSIVGGLGIGTSLIGGSLVASKSTHLLAPKKPIKSSTVPRELEGIGL